MRSRFRPFILFIWALYACATLQFVRFYIVSTTFYLDMPRYLSGHERLPFQERVLPIFLMWPINHSPFLMHHLTHPRGGFDSPSASTPELLAFYLVSLVSFSIASFLVVALYRRLTSTGALSALVFPFFMVLTLWTYVVHIDANLSFPYDFPSLAFFAGGLLAIYTHRFIPLALVIFFGTMNRETTLFLVGIYILDAASQEAPAAGILLSSNTVTSATNSGAPFMAQSHRDMSGLTIDALSSGTSPTLRERFNLRQIPRLRAALLFAIWFAVKYTLYRRFAGNDNSENFVRLWGNFGRLRPRLWPVLLNICGYILPIVVILHRRLRPLRFQNYLYILPVWFAVMFYTGVILETRIYGELCGYTAIAAVLLLEDHALTRARTLQPA